MNLLNQRYFLHLLAAMLLMCFLWILMPEKIFFDFDRILHGCAAFSIGVICQTVIIPKLPYFREFLYPDPLNPIMVTNVAAQHGANLKAGAVLATLLVGLLVAGLWWIFGFEVNINIATVSAMSTGSLFFYHDNLK
ncbi:hypothetical protein [Chitinibacter sp. GC72]|uniref:hypothetical protein n=1 Tax=Chitinibacter sp. GC72 TaxID=1526917 RepID=UPI0012FA38B2|nr:hypothetical protein [Chitinibacter sp. GC72]